MMLYVRDLHLLSDVVPKILIACMHNQIVCTQDSQADSMQSLAEVQLAAARFKEMRGHTHVPNSSEQKNIITKRQPSHLQPTGSFRDRYSAADRHFGMQQRQSLPKPKTHLCDHDSLANMPGLLQQQASLPVPRVSCVNDESECVDDSTTVRPCVSGNGCQQQKSLPADLYEVRSSASACRSLHNTNQKACRSAPKLELPGQCADAYSNTSEFDSSNQYTHVYDNSLAMQAADSLSTSQLVTQSSFQCTDQGDGGLFERPSHQGVQGSFSRSRRKTMNTCRSDTEEKPVIENCVDGDSVVAERVRQNPEVVDPARLSGLYKSWRDYRSLLWREHLSMVSWSQAIYMCSMVVFYLHQSSGRGWLHC